MRKYFFILFLSGLFSVSFAQERTIQGKVTTLENIAVSNARVKVKSTKQEVFTDTSGLFSVECNKNDRLKIYAHGFFVGKVKVTGNIKFVLANIKLKPGIENQNYAIGYGHITDVERLSALSTLNNDELDFSRYNNIFDVIQGRFPGVQIQGNQIIIRNTTTLVNNEGALIILDGRSVDFTTLNSLIPGDIKSINVIKDGSAAMYGVKGANGVVVIETKRGGD